jgi:hypothetical protein
MSGVNLYIDGRSEIGAKKDGNSNRFLRCVVTFQKVHCFGTCAESNQSLRDEIALTDLNRPES